MIGVSWRRHAHTRIQLRTERTALVPLLRQSAIVRVDVPRTWEIPKISSGPVELVFDGAYIWASVHPYNVVKIDIVTHEVVANISVGLYPEGLAFDGEKIWVANRGNNQVAIIDVNSDLIVGKVDVGDAPVRLIFDGDSIWVANLGGTVGVIDIESWFYVSVLSISAPFALASDGTYIWVTTGTALRPIDRWTHSLAGPPIVTGAYLLELVCDRSYLWATTAGGEVRKINVDTWRAEASVYLGRSTRGMALDGTDLWIATNPPMLAKVDVSENAVVARVGVRSLPVGVAFDGTHIWVSCYWDSVLCKVPALPLGMEKPPPFDSYP